MGGGQRGSDIGGGHGGGRRPTRGGGRGGGGGVTARTATEDRTTLGAIGQGVGGGARASMNRVVHFIYRCRWM